MRVFLSYRRDDSSPWTGRLRDALAARFGDEAVFQDVTGVRAGSTFDDEIALALASADATLAVIGPRWSDIVDAHGRRRLDDPDDHVRRELVWALASSGATIPVLVGGAVLPHPDELPEVLRPLVLRQAVELRDGSWHDDVDRLARALSGDGRARASSVAWHRPVLVAFVLAALAVALVAGVVMRDGAGGEPRDSSDGTVAADLPACESPSAPAWTDLGAADAGAGGNGRSWRFEVVTAHTSPSGEGWDVVVRLAGTNLQPGSMWFDPEIVALVGGDSWPLTCFGVIDGAAQISPGATSVALAGFTPSAPPEGTLTLDVDDSDDRYRLVVALAQPAG